MPIFNKKKKELILEQQQLQQQKDQQIKKQLEAQDRQIRETAAELDRLKREQADKEARSQYEAERTQREEERKEQERLDYEKFLEEQSRLKIADSQAEEQFRKTQASRENVRKLRELIRTRYQLDAVIWSKRGARLADQELTLKRMAQSDAVLVEIRDMVATWQQETFKRDEWRVAKKIKEGLLKDDKHMWEGNPPWYYR